jgi:hypothetical protein
MTYAAGDNRECMAQVRDMMKVAKAQRQAPFMGEREKQVLQNVYLFGHYDSRGGAAIVQAPNLASAMVAYAVGIEFNIEDADDVWAVGEEDSIGKRELVVLDEPFNVLKPQELLEGYAEIGGYKAAKVEYNFDLPKCEWTIDDRFLVLYKGELPKEMVVAPKVSPGVKNFDTKYRFVEDQLGEDAWGLFWIVYNPAFDVQVPDRSKWEG